MQSRSKLSSILFVLLLVLISPLAAQTTEKRIALVIGNADYQAGPLQTAANDAGLIAQTLQAAGFDVVGARDLDQESLRRSFRDFLDKASASGPDTVAYIYLAGYGLQLEGENYFVPVDARIARDTDVPLEALRISDYIRPLAALGLRAGIVVLDLARPSPFVRSGQPLAGGLALFEPEPGMLIAFNAMPGSAAPDTPGPYGAYAQSLAEMMREGGLPLGDVFDRLRLRVSDLSNGAEIPWHASRVEGSFFFFDRAPDAPPIVSDQQSTVRTRPISDFDAEEAYAAALDRDTLQGYEEFLTTYPDAPMAKRVRAIVASRREAITWRRVRLTDTPPAYWSYLRRYPRGPHAADARRRLTVLAAALEPPPSFSTLPFDIDPPPPEEEIYINRPVLMFDDPELGFAAPPPFPEYLLPPPAPEFVMLVPPLPPVELYALPDPVFVPMPIWVRPPRYVVPPPNNFIFTNIHNTTIINNNAILNDRGVAVSPSRLGAEAAVVPAVTLPPSLSQRATQIRNQNPQFEEYRQQLWQQRQQHQVGILQQQHRLIGDQRQQRQLLQQQQGSLDQRPQQEQRVPDQQRQQQRLLLQDHRQQQRRQLEEQRQQQSQQQQQLLVQPRQQQEMRQLERQRPGQRQQPPLDQQRQQQQQPMMPQPLEQRPQRQQQQLPQPQQQQMQQERQQQQQQQPQRQLEQQRQIEEQRQLEQQRQQQQQPQQQRQMEQQRQQQQQQRQQEQQQRQQAAAAAAVSSSNSSAS